MTRRKPETNPASDTSLLQMLEAAMGGVSAQAASIEEDAIARTSLRIPRAVLQEVSALASTHRMSVSLLINMMLDDYLLQQGRPGYAKLAPGYADYALRKKT